MDMGKDVLVQELHGDLARKYRIHRLKIEQLWSSFDSDQRAKAFKAGAKRGRVLKDPADRSLGDVYKMIPELNLRDIAESGPDHLLSMMKHRATKTLMEQYREGVDGGPGDHLAILNSMRDHNLRHAQRFRYCFTTFFDPDSYGKSYEVGNANKFAEVMAGMSTAVDAGLCVPQSTGELILERQLYTLQALNVLVEDILEASSTRNTKTRSKKPDEAARAALSNLTIAPKPEKFSLQSLEAMALDQNSALDAYLALCRTEPTFLAHAVNNWFFSRPELLQDERGRHLPLHTDKHINISFFEVLHNAVVAPAHWQYLARLLQLLQDEKPDYKARRSVILQEVSNTCQLEYARGRSLFKRHVQTGSGLKYFKRISGVSDNGIPRVSMKVKPETLTRDSPQLHYMLRLCQPETDAAKAVDWIKKLDDLHQAHPLERDAMQEREFDAFSDLATIASFIRSLSATLQLPPARSNKQVQFFEPRSKDLSVELNALKSEVDLSRFAIPIDNLLEPGMAEGALNALEHFIVEKTGTKLEFLYGDLIGDCVKEVLDSGKKKDEVDGSSKIEAPTAWTEAPAPEVRIQQRRQKDKTRPAHSSVFNQVETTSNIQPESVEPAQVFKVKPATYDVFSTLFSKSQSRGSITWTGFEAAMAELNFSVMPKTGSVFTFLPPKDMGAEKSITLHRPHQSRIEGHKLLLFAARLQRVYGWGGQSFEVE